MRRVLVLLALALATGCGDRVEVYLHPDPKGGVPREVCREVRSWRDDLKYQECWRIGESLDSPYWAPTPFPTPTKER